MIFDNPPRMISKVNMENYLQIYLFKWMRNISSGLNGFLDFDRNFQSFLAKDVEIAAGSEAEIPNPLNGIPTERYIVRQTGDGVITDGTWDAQTLRLFNNGAVDVVISVRFFIVRG